MLKDPSHPCQSPILMKPRSFRLSSYTCSGFYKFSQSEHTLCSWKSSFCMRTRAACDKLYGLSHFYMIGDGGLAFRATAPDCFWFMRNLSVLVLLFSLSLAHSFFLLLFVFSSYFPSLIHYHCIETSKCSFFPLSHTVRSTALRMPTGSWCET